MWNKNKQDETSEGSADGLQIVQLSLFLILLAFFIVLNMSSKYEDNKVQPVIKSLYQAFDSDYTPKEEPPVYQEQDLVKSLNQQQTTADYLERLFKSEIPTLETETNREMGTMWAQLSKTEFMSQIDAAGSSVFDKFIAALIYLEGQNRPYRLEVMIKRPGGLGTKSSIKELEGYADKLISRGVDPKLLSIGFSEKIDKGVYLYFRPYKAYVPRASKTGDAS